jgi:hypothetical protein
VYSTDILSYRVPILDDVKMVMKLGGGKSHMYMEQDLYGYLPTGIKKMVSSAFADRRHKRNNSVDQTGGAARSKSTEKEAGKV